jgi:thiosulfate/3-mercaptopyruvate sulfurtransferase
MTLRITALLSVSLFFGLRVMASPTDYPNASMLIEPSALAKKEIAQQFIVLDARERKLYEQGHIPGALWVDATSWAKAFKNGQDVEGWNARIGELGINSDSKVVVYDNRWFNEAARIWWILRYWGIEDVRLLNGNWIAWDQTGLSVEKGSPKAPLPAQFAAKPQAPRLATKDSVLASLKDNSLQIVDARSEGEFCGIDKLKNKRAGAIPGAKHLEWIDLIDKQTQRFKAPDQLRRLFAAAEIKLDRPTATHCQGGGRAAVMAFGMELMGASSVANYYASWGEWGNADDTPVVPGEPTKKP